MLNMKKFALLIFIASLFMIACPEIPEENELIKEVPTFGTKYYQGFKQLYHLKLAVEQDASYDNFDTITNTVNENTTTHTISNMYYSYILNPDSFVNGTYSIDDDGTNANYDINLTFSNDEYGLKSVKVQAFGSSGDGFSSGIITVNDKEYDTSPYLQFDEDYYLESNGFMLLHALAPQDGETGVVMTTPAADTTLYTLSDYINVMIPDISVSGTFEVYDFDDGTTRTISKSIDLAVVDNSFFLINSAALDTTETLPGETFIGSFTINNIEFPINEGLKYFEFVFYARNIY